MRFSIVAAALLVTPFLDGSPRRLSSTQSEETAVRQALTYYIRGHATGVADTMARAFHPDAELKFIRNGQYTRRTLAEYLSGFSGRPAVDEAQRQRRIVAIDIVGTAAVGKIELDYPNALLTDYMHLLKIGGEWRIVHKIFHSAPK